MSPKLEPQPPAVALIGGGPVALECLNLLYELNSVGRCRIIGISATHQVPTYNMMVENRAKALGIVMGMNPTNLLEAEPEICLSIGNGWIVPDELLNRPKRGIINFHAGPLPSYRGAAVSAFAILNGEDSFGVTFHKVSSQLDCGPIIHREIFSIDDSMTAGELDDACIQVGISVLKQELQGWIDGKYVEQQQAEGRAPYQRADIEPYRLLDMQWEKNKLWRHVRACDWDGVLRPAYFNRGGRKIYVTARMRGTYIS